MSDKQKYYLHLGGQLIGPYGAEELADLVKAGELRAEYPIYKVGENKWGKILQHPELMQTQEVKFPLPNIDAKAEIKSSGETEVAPAPEATEPVDTSVKRSWPRQAMAISFILFGVGVAAFTAYKYWPRVSTVESASLPPVELAPPAPPPPPAAPVVDVAPQTAPKEMAQVEVPKPLENKKEPLVQVKSDSKKIGVQKKEKKKQSFQSQMERKKLFLLLSKIENKATVLLQKETWDAKSLRQWKKEFKSLRSAEFGKTKQKLVFEKEWVKAKELHESWLKVADSLISDRGLASKVDSAELSKKTQQMKKKVQALSLQ